MKKSTVLAFASVIAYVLIMLYVALFGYDNVTVRNAVLSLKMSPDQFLLVLSAIIAIPLAVSVIATLLKRWLTQ